MCCKWGLPVWTPLLEGRERQDALDLVDRIAMFNPGYSGLKELRAKLERQGE